MHCTIREMTVAEYPLLSELLALLKARGYRRTSLAVQKANDAAKMYMQLGYRIVDENEQEYIMVYDLQ